MLNAVRQNIIDYNMLAPGDKVVVGLSGGADSVTLLSVLMSLGYEVFAVHVNHNLRGDGARRDEDFTQKLCEDLGVPLHVYQADVQGLADANKLSIEEAGRRLRYDFFNQALRKLNADKIAVGHNMDDNAETVLLNLFRGTGLRGLCGIPPVNGLVIRPLLTVSRKDIEIYAKENNLPYITDETNMSSDYSRNAIRNEIMPVIRRHFGNVPEVIARNTRWLREEEEYLSSIAKENFDMLAGNLPFCSGSSLPPAIQPTPQPKLSLQIGTLLSHPKALSSRIIREAIKTIRGDKALEDIQSNHIEAIIEIAQGRTGRHIDLPGFKAQREYDSLILYKSANPIANFSYPIIPEAAIQIPEINKSIKLSLTPQKHYTQAFNYDKVAGVLELRNRRPKDIITLAGLGTKKLQDYFIDTKTPRDIRDKTPLLADGSNILWILDKNNRINAAYQPKEGQATCWVTIEGACHDKHPSINNS